ncbi:MAG: peptidoglycan-binding domain-containing protein [Patescibacteria group bacterium]
MSIKSSQKIVAALLSVAMVLTLVVGLTTVSANAQTTTSFARNLTVGSRGADVTELQTILSTKGYLSVAPTGYFGSLTKAALAAWQASVNISPAAGYFGPITRAYIATMGTGSTGGTTTPTPGCATGAIYNSMTGALCSTGGTTSTPGTEGTLEVNQAATPSNNANIQSSTDVQVYGLDLRAKLGAVKIDRADLEVSVYNTTTTSYENPGNFVNTIKAWDGSTLLKSWTVGSSDFIKDSSNVYYIRLSDIGLTVPKDGMKNLVFSVNTNAGIDNDRTVVVSGYGSNSLRVSSGNNVVSYYNIDTVTRTHTFKKPGAATLTLQADASNPFSQTHRVTSTSGAQGVTLATFGVRAVDGDAKVTGVTLTSSSSATTAATLYLYDGSTLVDSRTNATTTTFSFSNSSVNVAKDATKVFTVKADFPTGTTNGTIASTTVNSVSYDKPNGSTATASATIAGNNQYFYSATPGWSSSSATAAVLSGGNTASSTGITATFNLKAKPVGGSMTLPVASDFTATVASSSSAVSLGSADSVTVSGNPSVLAEGSEYTVTVVFNVSTADLTGLGNGSLTSEVVQLTQAQAVVNGVTVTQTWGLNDFKTNPVTFVK